MKDRKELEIYIHIPFCAAKCRYCDFLSFPAGEETRRDYTNALRREIRAFPSERYWVSSVFIGGGTPSILPAEQITETLEVLKERFLTARDAEITIEANPGTVDEKKLRRYRAAGVNRISFGCQSASDKELETLGRIHRFSDMKKSFLQAREAGFSNINIDLMYAIPGQGMESWEKTLRSAAEMAPEHISAYSLIIEEGTPFFSELEKLALPDEDTEYLMREKTAQILKDSGYIQYEISNYAKPGFACRHNTGYWTGKEYAGFGLGASSYLDDTRFRHTRDMKTYLAMRDEFFSDRQEQEKLDTRGKMAEFMILGLRMTRGVESEEFLRRFGVPAEEIYGGVMDRYEAAGLLKREAGRIFLTRRGISLSNIVMADML